MLRIYLDVEYGYKSWYWFYPGTEEELIEDWKNGKAPLYSFDPSVGGFKGEMEEVEEEDLWEWLEGCGQGSNAIKAHVHDEDDTYLSVDGKIYYQSL